MARRAKDDPSVSGVVLVDKPAGATSHDVVGRARRALGVRRIGHSGTLDPAATGLLILGVGWVTRVLRFTGEHPKTYVADIALGTETTTWDAEGDVVESTPMSVTRDELDAALTEFLGEIEQVPPAYSAIKVGGEKLYDKARRGENVDPEPRNVSIHSLKVSEFDDDTLTLVVECSSGTYIRSLAHDLGVALGGHAHLAGLRRTRIGPHRVEDAADLDVLSDERRDLLLPAAVAMQGLATVRVDADDAQAVMHGRRIDIDCSLGPVGIIDEAGDLVAVFEFDGTRARPACVRPQAAGNPGR